MNRENFETLAREVHGDTYNYSRAQYQCALSHVTIICGVHGEFRQSPSKHVSKGQGCRKCNQRKANLKTTKQFILDAQAKHGDRYDYSETLYIDSRSSVTFRCRMHGAVTMNPTSHLAGTGCRSCHSSYSYAAISWLEKIAKETNTVIQHALSGGEKGILLDGQLRFVDGFCGETNTVYEFHGDFFHGNPNIYPPERMNTKVGETFGTLFRKTGEKDRLIEEAGFNLVVMWESDWTKDCKKRGTDPLVISSTYDLPVITKEERQESRKEKQRQYYEANRARIAERNLTLLADPENKAKLREQQRARYHIRMRDPSWAEQKKEESRQNYERNKSKAIIRYQEIRNDPEKWKRRKEQNYEAKKRHLAKKAMQSERC